MTPRQDASSAPIETQDSPIAGAAAQRPQMTSEEMRDRVQQAAGPFTPLRELRQQLPTARSDQARGKRGPQRTRGAGAQPRGAGEATARGDIAPLTGRQRELVIDQAILMLEEL